MHNDLTKQLQELRLQEKYPIGTRGRIKFEDYQVDSYLSLGWTPEDIAVVESVCVSGGFECLITKYENDKFEPFMCKAEDFQVLDEDQT